MNTCLESPPKTDLCSTLADRIFDIIPDQGLDIAFLDKEGNIHVSNRTCLGELFSDRDHIDHLIARIKDGDDPVISHFGDRSIIASELSAGSASCGYVFLALPDADGNSAVANMDLVEFILNQLTVIADLTQKTLQ